MRMKAAVLSSAILLILLAASACDVGTALYTEKELGRMFDVAILQDGAKLSQGSRINAGRAIKASVSSEDDSRLAATLELSLSDADGLELATVRFSTTAGEGSILVPAIAKDLPAFTLPENLADGYYTLNSTVRDRAESILSSAKTVLLVYDGDSGSPSLAAYPGAASPGRVTLLKVDAALPAGLDPWIRWVADGSERAAGPASERYDRLAWKAPSANGIYTIRAEIYPFKPPLGAKVPAFSKAELRIPISQASARPDASSDVPWARFELDGDLSDSGARPRKGDIRVLGSPYLETHASGYGYLLGAGAGLESDSAILPVGEDRLAPFSASFLIALPQGKAASASGRLLSIDSPSGELVIGIEELRPYVAFKGEVAKAETAIDGLARVSVAVEASYVRFYIDDKPAGGGSIGSDVLGAAFGRWRIAGADGFRAVYDDISLSAGPWQAFRRSEESARGKALIAASGFEGGLLGPGLASEGELSLSHGRAGLGPGASLSLGAAGLPSHGATIALGLEVGTATVRLELDDGSILALGSDGSIRVGDALSLSAGPRPLRGLIEATVERGAEGLRVVGFDGRELFIGQGRPAATARLTVENRGEEPLILSRLSAFESTGASARPTAPSNPRATRLVLAPIQP